VPTTFSWKRWAQPTLPSAIELRVRNPQLFDHTAVDGDTEIDASSGNDRLELVDVDFEDDVEVDLGDGDDDVRVEDCEFDGEIDADGGDGNDELHLSGDNGFDLREDRRVQDFEDFD